MRFPAWSETEPPTELRPFFAVGCHGPTLPANRGGRRLACWMSPWSPTGSPPHDSSPAYRSVRNTAGSLPPNAAPSWETRCHRSPTPLQDCDAASPEARNPKPNRARPHHSTEHRLPDDVGTDASLAPCPAQGGRPSARRSCAHPAITDPYSNSSGEPLGQHALRL